MLIFIFLTFFLLGAFFSGAEMAFVSSNRIKLRKMADSGSRSARQVLRFLKLPQRFLAMILIGNNIFHITVITIFTYWVDAYFGIRNEWFVTAVMAPLLLVFSEMVPKGYCRLSAQDFLLKTAPALQFFMRIFDLPTRVILAAIDLIIKPLGLTTRKGLFASQKELCQLIEDSEKTGVVSQQERRMINKILDFERIRVESAMIPLDQVPKIDIANRIGDVRELARREHTKMVLVYEEIPTLIVGMVYVFDVLFEENVRQGLKDYLRSPVFLPKDTSIEKAFLTLQERRQSIAVVTDHSGEVIGVVPIERLLVV